MTPPSTSAFLPGWRTHRRLAFGRHASVYLARAEADGRWAALRVLTLPEALDPGDALAQARARTLWRDPGLVGAHDVALTPGGQLAAALDLAEGGTLEGLRSDRGHLRPGEIVTLLLPVAGTLERLRGSGRTHEDLREGTVLLTRTGRPVLADAIGALGSRWWRAGSAGSAAVADVPPEAGLVRRLGELAAAALPGTARGPGRPLVELVRHCLAPDPGDRPTLREVADRLAVAAEPVPVYPVDTDDDAFRLTLRVPERFLPPPGTARDRSAADRVVSHRRPARAASRWRGPGPRRRTPTA